MQFHREGYRPGDPFIAPEAPGARRTDGQPNEVDVLIVGTGPAGSVLGAQLSTFPGITTRIVERRERPLEVGHADGIAVRTVELFDTFGLSAELLREAYRINETRFWGPSEADSSQIARTGWVQDTPDGVSEFPHVIVNQARMQQYLADYMGRSATRLGIEYGIEFVGLVVGEGEYPVTVTLRHVGGDRAGTEFTVKAKYVVGCDGARSAVRTSIGRELHGESQDHAWGVMDVLANTDFPDWRTKNLIGSAGKGSMILIPREGGVMVRCYVDLGVVPAGDTTIRQTTVEQIIAQANAIMHPYTLDVRSVAWFSVYEVGQRVTDKFDDVQAGEEGVRTPHVFIAGDACHTHSAKAGQGLNVSMMDAFNLGWKLVSVLSGLSDESLLHTYSAERQPVANDLIEFDRFWADFVAKPRFDPARPELGGVTAEEMQATFAQEGRYLAGLATRYPESRLIGSDAHQYLATGFEIGTRFHSAQAIRVADARRAHLGHVHRADGRWRIYAFGASDNQALIDFAEWAGESPDSPLVRFTPEGADVDAVFDLYGIFRCGHHDIEINSVPAILRPQTGSLGLIDWEKVWAVDPSADIFAERGIHEDGAVVVVRPDQYVAHVLPLSERAELTSFFAGILREARP